MLCFYWAFLFFGPLDLWAFISVFPFQHHIFTLVMLWQFGFSVILNWYSFFPFFFFFTTLLYPLSVLLIATLGFIYLLLLVSLLLIRASSLDSFQASAGLLYQLHSLASTLLILSVNSLKQQHALFRLILAVQCRIRNITFIRNTQGLR